LSKILSDILYKVPLKEVKGATNKSIESVCFDSRKAVPNTLFIAIVGTQSDGHRYIEMAISKGATAVLCETFPEVLHAQVSYLRVENSAKALGTIADNFYNQPSSQLKLIGITGTNGKTTTATLLFKLFRSWQFNVGLISTIQHQINETIIEATHTTPDVLTLNALLAQMVDEGCEFCFMEVSSHAVVQERIAGITFAGGIFTNISHDHLDYHGTFKEYIRAKKGFFDQLPSTAFALSNLDDKRGAVMLQNTRAAKYTYSLKKMSDFRARILENSFAGLLLNIEKEELHALLIGEFNAYNLLAIYSVAYLLGESKIEILKGLSTLTTAEGRFDYVKNDANVIGIVDYAHTPDALLNVLTTINDLRTRNEQLITIVGCGGDRDKQKRPIMAKVACEMSDRIILTSDNPRTEDPDAIIQDMQKGVEPQWTAKVLSITNRREAIKTAAMLANSGDIILIAGKGHEKYQEINGVKRPFDDKQVLRETLDLAHG